MRPSVCKASSSERGGGARLPHVVALGAALGFALAGGGCSFSLPVISPAADDAPAIVEPVSTGTLGPRPVPQFAAELGPEDWRRASAALAVALDPQGNGKAVKWENPESDRRGAVEAAGPPFVKNDEVCRPFMATVAGPGLTRQVRGTACRPSGGAWEIKQAGPPAPGRRPG